MHVRSSKRFLKKIAQEVYLDEIIELAKTAPAIEVEEFEAENIKKDITIGIAQDKAFFFLLSSKFSSIRKFRGEVEIF